MAMSQMYDKLFDGERKNKTILSVCPGMELHEMGARIVADLFENHGWDSIFLGAAVPGRLYYGICKGESARSDHIVCIYATASDGL